MVATAGQINHHKYCKVTSPVILTQLCKCNLNQCLAALSLKSYCFLGKGVIQLTCEQWSRKTWQAPSTSMYFPLCPWWGPLFVASTVFINFKIECCGPVIKLMSSSSKSMTSQSQHMAPSQCTCILICNSHAHGL